MISFDLTGRTALVTGGASGIGLETATLLARSGARVAVNHLPGDARAVESLAALTDKGFDVIAAPGDVGDPDSARDLVTNAAEALGRLDLLVNNAGIPGVRSALVPSDLEAVSEDLWQNLLNVNLLGAWRCTTAAAPFLRAAGGAIVNLGSVTGLGKVGSSIPYGTSKAGVIHLTKSLAAALAPDVRVNAVAPAMVDSSWAVDWTDESKAAFVAKTPLQRLATTADIAELIVYLGFGARMVTGEIVVTDGGSTL